MNKKVKQPWSSVEINQDTVFTTWKDELKKYEAISNLATALSHTCIPVWLDRDMGLNVAYCYNIYNAFSIV